MTEMLGDAKGYAHFSVDYVRHNATPEASSACSHASQCDRSQLRDDSLNPWMPNLLNPRPDLVRAVIALCKEATRWAH
jgi:hypothetical protein